MRFDLRCLLCARVLGSVEADHTRPAAPVLFRPAGQARGHHIADWRLLRCECGGNTYPDELTTVRVYPPVRWDDDEHPRRGRPPKWLAEARKAEAASSP